MIQFKKEECLNGFGEIDSSDEHVKKGHDRVEGDEGGATRRIEERLEVGR